jgi:CRISPR-associated endonuclease/helicase Cas3
MADKFPSHIKYIENKKIVQTVFEHSHNTAKYASEALKSCCFENTGYLAGLLHDMGKYTEEYSRYIEKAAKGENVIRGSVNHTFAGVIYMFENYHNDTDSPFIKITCEIIAYAIGAHHGLFDCIDENGKDGFNHRVSKDKKELSYEEALTNFMKYCSNEKELNDWFERAKKEIELFHSKLKVIYKNKAEANYTYGILSKLILSALIEADRRDTLEFYSGSLIDSCKFETHAIWKDKLAHLEKELAKFTADTDINIARKYISDRCKEFSDNPTGIYKLNVPTGGGKTLSTLRYALAHSEKYNKRRIFFVIPLLSVIEQNARVIRDYINDDNLILEHHSNVVIDDENTDELSKYELLTDTWNSPIIITTLVQFLYTLFDKKSSSIRRIQALTNSVIIIDEIQSLPLRMTYLMNMTLNFLAKFCKTTIILSSATQPSFEKIKYYPLQFNNPPDMVRLSDEAMQKAFKRTKIINSCRLGGYSVDDLAKYTYDISTTTKSILVICNTKKAAKSLYEQLALLKMETLSDYTLYHLSTSMCMEHRKTALRDIKNDLAKNNHIICVSTQLVEAGIDFSFECVLRYIAGLDNLTQAAGRCNRNGEFGKICNVYLVNIKDENLSHLSEIKNAKEIMEEFIYKYEKNQSMYGNDVLSNFSIETYYEILFSRLEDKNALKYPVNKVNSSIFEMLSLNSDFSNRLPDNVVYDKILMQAFKTAADNFTVFDNNTTDIIVPYNKTGKDIISELYSEKAKYDFIYLKKLISDAKPYTVSVFDYQLRKLVDIGAVTCLPDKPFITLNSDFYNKNTGLDMEETAVFDRKE